jgi:radical SAM protein with 4Fe4S-binding SPASM domain
MCLCRWWTVESQNSVNWKSLVHSSREILGNLQVRPGIYKPGLFKFDRTDLAGKSRIHLRVDPDGHGTLLVNASQIYHLNPSAAFMAFLYLSDKPDAEVISRISQMYQISAEQSRQDYQSLLPKLEALTHPGSACPICDLELDTNIPFSARPTAPYRMDLALTYRCNNNCAHCYNARPRNFTEMPVDSWKKVLRHCWDLGIPHIIFTGGEPTLRDDLPELIAYAQSLGQITGINTNGRRLSNPDYLQRLVDAGLDHVQITLESSISEIHDALVCHSGAWQETTEGIRNVAASSLYFMTNTTLLRDNAAHLSETLDFLHELNVPTVGLNALIYSGKGKTVGTGLSEAELPSLLNLAGSKTHEHGQRLIWYTPTQYCHFDPQSMQLGIKGCTAALYNMCIEPDGSVLPCQSYYQSLGNILSDRWSEIWEHPLSLSLRERRNVPGECRDCALLLECGSGCPLHRLENRPVPILKEFA